MSDDSHRYLDPRLEPLLEEWSDRIAAGESISVEALCEHQQDLAEPLRQAIQALNSTRWVLESDDEPQSLVTPENSDSEKSLLNIFREDNAESLLTSMEQLQLVPEHVLSQAREHITADRFRETIDLLRSHGVTTFQLTKIAEDRQETLLIDDYLILEPIAEGGMGRVYRAVHRSMERMVALKLMRQELFDSLPAVERFRREVRVAAKLSHPHIVTAFDSGQQGHHLYLVMEYVPGENLGALLKREGVLPIANVVNYMRQAAEGLAYAHQQGVIHRDVKPWNLLLDEHGTVKVLDLGLARQAPPKGNASSIETGLTAADDVMGTIDFIAPEQARESRQADERSDIYSLGCTLYLLLHSRPVYDGELAINRLLAHQANQRPSLQQDREDIPETLNDVFVRMIAKEPRDRYQSMDEVVAALSLVEQELAQDPIQLAAEHQRTQRQRYWFVTGVLSLVVLLIWALGFPNSMPSDSDLAPQSINTQATTIPSPQVPIPGQTTEIEIPQASEPKVPRIPQPAVFPLSNDGAQRLQEAWAEHLDVPEEFQNSVGMLLRLIPPGEFPMGTEATQSREWLADPILERYADTIRAETPQHTVRITQPFYCGVFEVTQQEYQTVTGVNPAYRTPETNRKLGVPEVNSDRLPIENVSWLDAIQFCNRLSRQESISPAYVMRGNDIAHHRREGYQLPTEAQWEYVCRSGDQHQVLPYFELSKLQHGRRNRSATPALVLEVHQTDPIGYGIQGMIGNVSEWCWDWYDPGYYALSAVEDPYGPTQGARRALRGGNVSRDAWFQRTAYREGHVPRLKGGTWGFRVVLPLRSARQVIEKLP